MKKSITRKRKRIFLSFVGSVFLMHAISAGVLSGFPVCRLGRSCYANDVYLGKTLISDFCISNAAIRAEGLKNGFAGFSPVGETLGLLDKAYAENPEFILRELQEESENISLSGINGLTGDIRLPVTGSLDPSVTLSWASSHPGLVSSEGKVNRPEYVDAHVTLTARFMKDGQSLTRTFLATVKSKVLSHYEKTRVIVTTDGEDDDKASMVRFLLTTNEFDVEGIINSSSQFHWVGGKGWNAFKPVSWIKEYIHLYAQVYGNLVQHDRNYPSPEFLLSKWAVGNINGVGEDTIRTKGAELIAKVLLDDSDPRPVWIQAWGGCNTISRALKIIQEDYPERMEEAAAKMRLYLIWEQDGTYQKYIRPNWEHYNIPTIISDQFDCIAYIWPKVLPSEVKKYFEASWMNEHILKGHGALCRVYVNNNGAYNAEGDTPAFLHCIPNGLRSLESPGNGGWGGRYVKVRNNVWMDPPPAAGYTHPSGQWGFSNSWSKMMENYIAPGQVVIRTNYFKPVWRWLGEVQADFAARADWCVKGYASANHHPVVRLKDTPFDIVAQAGSKVVLDASPTTDPDGDELTFRWWHYSEAGTYEGETLAGSDRATTTITIPEDARPGETIHMICEVSDSGTPSLTRYQRVVITVTQGGRASKIRLFRSILWFR